MIHLTLDVEVDEGLVRIGAPTAFSTDWLVVCTVQDRIGDVLRLALRQRFENKAADTVQAHNVATERARLAQNDLLP